MLRRSKTILGISYGHGDSSAALIVDGKIIAAAEEERFNRIKHYAGFPTEATRYCLAEAGVSPLDVQVIAVARNPWNQIIKKASLALSQPQLILQRSARRPSSSQSFSDWVSQMGLSHARKHSCEHHEAHMLSSRYLPESENQALLSFDGLGDFVSAAIGKTTKHGVKILDRVTYPHSLGFFYTAMTQYLGFPYFGDEFKVMGLSSLGKPTFLSQMRNLVREVEPFGFRINLEAFPVLRSPGIFSVVKSQPTVAPLFNAPYLTAILGIPPRKPKDHLSEDHWNLAKSVQVRFEEIANHLLVQLSRKVDSETLALSGGCAHNSVWVGKIPQNSRFKDIFVAPASHDAGIAIGAAISANGGSVSLASTESHPALLGPTPFDTKKDLVIEGLQECSLKNEHQLLEFLAREIASGKIVGVARGRLEFGPRALGNRSILADPRKAEMKDILNARVKHRESFRPFAASVLREHQGQWFENTFYAPTMEAVFQVRPSMREKIRGVVHADGSCRIQSVDQKTQPFYWKLIEAFRQQTGIPMLINTSFNDSEPIVLTTEDALRCFTTTEMDYLLLENRLFTKKAQSLSLSA
ncbi:MAG: carbamoyltransferase [Proteobacteria bacterium]|nr:carbamoyltransferase [Pseudomonadota bacterium]